MRFGESNPAPGHQLQMARAAARPLSQYDRAAEAHLVVPAWGMPVDVARCSPEALRSLVILDSAPECYRIYADRLP